MSRPRRKPRTSIQQALICLRRQLNMTQQELAVEMETTTTTVARWESSLSPRGRALSQLADFAAYKGLTEWAALFRRAILQEDFLDSTRQYLLADEGLDLQIGVANVYQFREHPKVARSFSQLLDALVHAHQQVALLVKKDTELVTTEDLIALDGRLRQYRKKKQGTTPKEGKQA